MDEGMKKGMNEEGRMEEEEGKLGGMNHLAPGLDHDTALGELGDLQDVVVGLGRQPAHEVELDLAPAGA
jgi:hypothetical protein